MSARTSLFAVGALSSALSFAGGAHAFCRTTTCDPNKPADACEFDDQSCLITGKPLAWASSCVTVGIHELGAPSLGFSFDDIAPVVEQAFEPWLKADCGSGTPSIDVRQIGPIECGLSEYNQKAHNTNLVLFREDEWPYIGAENAIGLTTTRFDKRNGQLWDADIELNAVTEVISIGDPIEGYDLLSVLTHEAGHFLGMSHSHDQTATMKSTYDPDRDGTEFRTLADDDVAGICTIYPPERRPSTTSCDNRHGFSEQCGADQPPLNESKGCSVTAAGKNTQSDGFALALLAGVVVSRLARRRRVV